MVIGLEADFYGFRAVVFAVEERRAGRSQMFSDSGGWLVMWKTALHLGASAAATETGDDFGDGQFVIDYGAKGRFSF